MGPGARRQSVRGISASVMRATRDHNIRSTAHKFVCDES
jgi:hypothetical protein